MELSELEQHLLAFYLLNGAQELNLVGRWWPRPQLAGIIQDKIEIAARKFGMKVTSAAPNPAKAYLQMLLDRDGFSTKEQDFGGTMHQFQPKEYEAALREIKAANPVVQQAEGAGPDFWTDAFGRLTSK